MQKLLYAAGTSFLRAFGVAFLMFATGILSAPNRTAAIALSIAALMASLAAGFRAVQVFVPFLSWKSLVKQPLFAAWADSFTRAAVAAFLVTVTGWLAAPDFGTWKAVGLSAIIGGLTAGVRAIQGLVTSGEEPASANGI